MSMRVKNSRIGSFKEFNLSELIAYLFIVAMIFLIMALLNFICKIYLATAPVRGGP